MGPKYDKDRPSIQSEFRTELILTPDAIRRASGIIINGRRYKSFLFSSDVGNNYVYRRGCNISCLSLHTPNDY